MKYFGKYFKYRLKEAIGYFLIITLILIVIAALFEISTWYGWYGNLDKNKTKDDMLIYSNLDYLFIAYNLIPFVVTICEFSSLMNKRNSDTAMSFPISKRGITFAHYLVSIIATVSSMVISFAVAYSRIVIIAMNNGIRDYPIFTGILGFLMAVLYAIIIVTIVSFIFNCANSLLDGIVFVAAWTNAPYVIDYAYYAYRYAFVRGTGFPKLPINLQDLILINTISGINKGFEQHIVGSPKGIEKLFENISQIQILVILTGVSVLAFIGLFLVSKRKKVETIGDMSDSWLGYKVLVPLYGVCIALIGMVKSDEILSVPIVIGGMFSGYCLYRKGVRLRLPDIIWIVGTTGFSLIRVLIEALE